MLHILQVIILLTVSLDYFEKVRLQIVNHCLASVDNYLANCCPPDTIHVLETCECFTCCHDSDNDFISKLAAKS